MVAVEKSRSGRTEVIALVARLDIRRGCPGRVQVTAAVSKRLKCVHRLPTTRNRLHTPATNNNGPVQRNVQAKLHEADPHIHHLQLVFQFCGTSPPKSVYRSNSQHIQQPIQSEQSNRKSSTAFCLFLLSFVLKSVVSSNAHLPIPSNYSHCSA